MSVQLKIGQPRFLSKLEVLTLHKASLDAYGGAEGFLNEGALDSAIAQAQQGFGGQFMHEFPFGMAAAYGYHIGMNHAFRDGNKRTAFAAMVTFLRMNGWNFSMPDAEAAGLMLTMIEEHRDKAWLAKQLEAHCKARPSFELRDFFAAFQIEAAGTLNDAMHQSSPAEILATADEALQNIPLVRQMILAGFEYPDEYRRGVGIGQVLLLILMFRIAEDLGYEW